jgi:hypothetical protein
MNATATASNACPICEHDIKPKCFMCSNIIEDWPTNPKQFLRDLGWTEVKEEYGPDSVRWLEPESVVKPPMLEKVGETMSLDDKGKPDWDTNGQPKLAPRFQIVSRQRFSYPLEEAVRLELEKQRPPAKPIVFNVPVFTPQDMEEHKRRRLEARARRLQMRRFGPEKVETPKDLPDSLLLPSDEAELKELAQRVRSVGFEPCVGCGRMPARYEEIKAQAEALKRKTETQ